MPFLVIRGTFHVTGVNVSGNPTGFQPDGDSIQFKPHVASRLDELEQPGNPYRLTRIGSVNLRFEGIDAPELHYQGTRASGAAPRTRATSSSTGEIGMNPVTYGPSRTTVAPPGERRAGGVHPVALARVQRTARLVRLSWHQSAQADGQQVFLNKTLLQL